MIGVFDSGVGGLHALALLQRKLPKTDFVYLADTLHLPYGRKRPVDLRQYVNQALHFFQKFPVSAVLFACGTVSTTVLPGLVAPFPVYGVASPTVKRAVRETENGKIALLATEATVKSGYFSRHISLLRPTGKVFSFPCPQLVSLAEKGEELKGFPLIPEIRKTGCDTLILGCTHFAAFRNMFSEELPGVTLLDCGEIGAEELLRRENFPEESGKLSVYTTGSPEEFDRKGSRFPLKKYKGAVCTLF